MTSVREDSGNLIENYLARVEAGLKGGDEGQRQEILAEIRSHLMDRIEELRLQGAENPTEVALAAMGDPDALSMQFIAEGVARDSRSRFPWVLLRAAARVATTGMRGTLVLLLGVVGYAAAFALIAAAVAKVLDPAGVGFWVGPHTGVIWGYPRAGRLVISRSFSVSSSSAERRCYSSGCCNHGSQLRKSCSQAQD